MSRSPSDEPVSATSTRSRVSHGSVDPVPPAVLREPLVDAVGEPGERELAQRREVARPEVVGERGVDPLRRVDVAAGEAVPKRDRRQVDQLQLVGPADDLVGDRLALLDRR